MPPHQGTVVLLISVGSWCGGPPFVTLRFYNSVRFVTFIQLLLQVPGPERDRGHYSKEGEEAAHRKQVIRAGSRHPAPGTWQRDLD